MSERISSVRLPSEFVCQPPATKDHWPIKDELPTTVSQSFARFALRCARVTSERADAQMDHLMGRTTSSDPKRMDSSPRMGQARGLILPRDFQPPEKDGGSVSTTCVTTLKADFGGIHQA